MQGGILKDKKKRVAVKPMAGTGKIESSEDVFTEDFIRTAKKERLNKPYVLANAQQALTAYYGDPSIEIYIRAFSPRENAEKLQWRQERTAAHYQNFVRSIAAKYIEGVFSAAGVVRDVKDIPDFDEKKYFTWFKKEVAAFSLIMPELYIGLKSREPEAEIKTRADQQRLQGAPYPVVIYPDYVHNFEISEDGSLEWISIITKRGTEVVKEGVSTAPTGIQYSAASASVGVEELQIFTKDYVASVDKNGNFVQGKGPVKHGYPYVPIHRVTWEDNNRFSGCESTPIGHSMMYTVIQLSLASLQFISMLVEAGYAHLNLKLMIDKDVADRMIQTGMGNMTVIPMSKEPGEKEAKYLQVPTAEFDKLIELIYTHCPSSIYSAARLIDRQIAKQQSGVAKIVDLIPEINVISEVAEYFQSIEQWTLNAIASGYKGSEVEVPVSYPTDFKQRSDSNPLSDLTEISNAAKSDPTLPFPPEMIAELIREVMKFILPDASDDIIKSMEEYLKNWINTMQQVHTAKLATRLDTALNPPEQNSNPSDGMGGEKQTGNIINPTTNSTGAV